MPLYASTSPSDDIPWSNLLNWHVVDPSRHAVVWMLVAFLLTTILTRVVTRHIRAKDEREALRPESHDDDRGGLIKNIHIGGIHVHHQVWGILLVLIVGALLIAYRPSGAVLNSYAVAFGIGASLALDEFAMWLHLEDVYWSEDGRKSISALLIAGAAALALAVGADPLDFNDNGGAFEGTVVAAVVAFNLFVAIICVLKGKLQYALIGIFLPLIGPIGALRLAKPGSWWARRRYPEGSSKLARAQNRFGPAYEARWRRLQDFIGGTPTPQPDANLPTRASHDRH